MQIPRLSVFLLALRLFAAPSAHPPAPQRLTISPAGPIHVERNRLVDSRGRAFLIRGTSLPEFRTDSDRRPVPAPEFAPHSATVLSTIRLRWNMNAVRLPLSVANYQSDARYLAAVRDVVERAHEVGLLVILAAPGPSVPERLWSECAAAFRDYPQVLFELDAATPEVIRALRTAGAKQVVLLEGWRDNLTNDANAIYAAAPQYQSMRTDGDRDRHFAPREQVPMLAADLDPHLDRAAGDCASFPADPSDAEAWVQANLEYFDAHGISWIASEFRPGKLIIDYRHLIATSLENGFTCGQPEDAPYGIGEAVQFHQWGGEVRGLFAVSAAGSFLLPRGSVGIVYGGIFAEEDSSSHGTPLPAELGKLSVRITDHSGVTRRAGLLYASEGWGQANFVVPTACARGLARVTLARRDGTTASAQVTIVDVAPGLWTAPADGRGPAFGFDASGAPLYRCRAGSCATVPIPISATRGATVRIMGSGIRNAAGLAAIRAKAGGVRIPVIAYGPAGDNGGDQLTLRIPPSLRGKGEADLLCSIHGRVSNVVRINLGSAELSR